jgi:hypothetical protein
MAGFNGLTFAVVPVVKNTGSDGSPTWTLQTSALPAGTVIAGILDPNTTNRIFDPVAEGNPVATSDAYTKWLPTVAAAGVTAASVVDNLQASAPTEYGQVTIPLTPAAANTVEAPSVMTFKVSPRALVITATAGTF